MTGREVPTPETSETDGGPGGGLPGGRPADRGAERLDEPFDGPFDEPLDEALYDDEREHHLDEEPAGHTVANTALWLIVGALAVASGAIWLAPKLAPHVPAPIARYLAPVSEQLEAELATLRAELAAQERAAAAERAELSGRLADLSRAAARSGLDEAAAKRIAALERALDELASDSERLDIAAEAARAQARAALAEAEAARTRAQRAAEAAEAAETSAATASTRTDEGAEALSRMAERLAQAERTAVASARDAEAAGTTAETQARAVSELEDRLAVLSGELRALRQTLAETPARPGDQPAGRELNAAVQALQARLDGLEIEMRAEPDYLTRADAEALARRAALEALAERTTESLDGLEQRIETLRGTLAGDLARIEQTLAADLAGARSAIGAELAALSERVDAAETAARRTSRQALDEAETALRNAALRGAIDALETRVAAGEPYAVVLAEIETLTGQRAPEALAAHAAGGLVSTAALLRRLPADGRTAMEAEARAGAGDDAAGDRLASWLRAQVFARPTSETAGAALPARLSRIEARLAEGDDRAALAEAASLPDAARAAMSGWIGDLENRVAATEALARFVAPTRLGE